MMQLKSIVLRQNYARQMDYEVYNYNLLLTTTVWHILDEILVRPEQM